MCGQEGLKPRVWLQRSLRHDSPARAPRATCGSVPLVPAAPRCFLSMNAMLGGLLPPCCHQAAFLDQPPPSHTTDTFLTFLSWTAAPPGDEGSAMLSVRSRQLINHSAAAVPVHTPSHAR